MQTASESLRLKFFSGLLIFVFFILPVGAQQKKKTGGTAKTPPKKASNENQDRDLKSRTEKSTVGSSSTSGGSFKTSPNLSNKKRLALVIGNSQYESSPLRNPVNDALLIGRSLENLGFQVSVKENLNFQEMKETIQSFSRQLAGGGVGLFYFAGHGIQINGRNFLIPVDFNAEQTDVSKQAVEVDYVIREITGKGGLNILILDACRNAPAGYTVPSDKEGLAEIRNAPIGTYIAFSTAPGKKAKDGRGNNSPYAVSLADNLKLRPSRLEDVFIRTRIQMDNVTSGQQTPWENSSLNSVFFFSEDVTAPAQNTGGFNPDISAVGRILNLPFAVPLLNESGNIIKQLRQTASYFVEGQTGLEMMQIQNGNFRMGTSWEIIDAAYKDAKKYKDSISQETVAAEMPQHQVNVPGFFISKTEITQSQWQAVMGNLPEIEPDFRGANLPVVKVSWRQANAFCKKLSQMTGNIYRLPTEAEWEYAAKGGSESPFAFGKTITSDLANYRGTSPFLAVTDGVFRKQPIPVGSLKNLNAFGLADMHGNVWEWTADNWHDDYDGAPTDGSAWEAQEPEEDSEEQDPRLLRVIRGGSWDSIASNCRSTSRRKQPQMTGSNKIGFRVVMQ